MMGENQIININFDVRCSRCKKFGVMNETNLCMKCIGKQMIKDWRRQVGISKEARGEGGD